MTWTAEQLAQVCRRASRTSGSLSVVLSDAAAPGPTELVCADVLADQRAGGDPTAAWRAACAIEVERQTGATPPVALAPTFVLQWYLGALASATAHLTAAQDRLLPPRPESMTITLSAPGGYPVGVAVPVGAFEELALGRRERLARAGSAYRAHARAFVDSYRPGVKLSSRHRIGSMTDAWDAALATVDDPIPPPAWRESCCYIYAIPGAHECARCPRRNTGTG